MGNLLDDFVYSLKKVAVVAYTASQLAFPVFAGDVSLSGRVVNSHGVGLSNKNVVLFLNNNEKKLNGVTNADGVYVIPFTPSDVRHEYFLPEGYSVSNNYPNPFNPATNVNITLPERSRVEMKVYDMLAQELGTVVDGEYDAGVHGVNVDLEDLVSSPSQGVYILKTVINDAYANAKKILFLRDSQHAGSFNFGGVSSNNYFSKVSLQDVVDSMHVNGRSILPTSKSLGVIISGDTDLGDVVVDSAFNVDGKVISTIRYDQPNNHLPNLTVIIDGYSAVSDSLGNFSVQVPVDS
ncbi:TPA: carboxypeptidase regulatory-like domain-containing protein, partial [Candidatus Woesearchaeota archaeon]|nr:carboxypeptidase regulatory-like domain-containing protein [Candidatus Woesearchaeota archaeon]